METSPSSLNLLYPNHRDFAEAVRERLGEDRRLLFDLAVQSLAWTEISAIVGDKPDGPADAAAAGDRQRAL